MLVHMFYLEMKRLLLSKMLPRNGQIGCILNVSGEHMINYLQDDTKVNRNIRNTCALNVVDNVLFLLVFGNFVPHNFQGETFSCLFSHNADKDGSGLNIPTII